MKIYIGFSKPRSKFAPFASLIKWVESRPYDHVYIRLPEPMEKQYIIFQASKEMVNICNLSIFFNANISIKEYEIEISDQQYELLWKFVKANLGIPYSLLEDFGILLTKVFKIKQPFNSGMSSQFCSKLGAVVCQLFSININNDPGAIDPTALDSILEKNKILCILNPILSEKLNA